MIKNYNKTKIIEGHNILTKKKTAISRTHDETKKVRIAPGDHVKKDFK